jgi:membrane protein
MTEPRAWYWTRLASLGFVLGAVLGLVALSTFLVAVPLAVKYASTYIPWAKDFLIILDNWSLWGAVITMVVALFIAHLYMPAGRRRIIEVVPGIVLTIIAWVAGAYIFGYYLSTFANYARTYAGLASIMIALVFLYMIGVIFILGAEVNAALIKYRIWDIVLRKPPPPPSDEFDQTANI